ncbi:hypothetical protein WG902_19965 [Ramlibacter sp. PS3R-8]|uniref:hypothetical protein n=1 Tax=Ramlibacter sp. PS3R-8 TaxID=3133437 RepID=UPI0030A3B440
MVMFKAKFKPMVADKPSAGVGRNLHRLQQQQQQQPQPQPQPVPEPEEKAPPVDKEQGEQIPVKEPGPPHQPQRVR